MVDTFTPEAAESLDDDNTIKVMLGKSRDSAIKLAVLLGDSRSQFSGSSMKGQIIKIQESSQVKEVRERLTGLQISLNCLMECKTRMAPDSSAYWLAGSWVRPALH